MHRKQITSVHFQFLAALCGNLSNVSFGAIFGWLLITAAGLQTHDRTHLGVQPLSDLELTWVVSVVYLAAGVGAAYLSWMADGFGKKHTLCTLSLAKFLSWGIYMLATNATEMYLAGAIGGFAAGGSLILVPLFIAEVAEDSVRGVLSTTTMLGVHVGMMISYVVLCFVPSQEAAYGLIGLPIIFVFAFVYFPDTPYQLRKEYRHELSLEALYFYRGCRDVQERKADFMKKEVLRFEQTSVDVELSKTHFVSRASIRAFALLILVIVAQQLVSNFFTLAYMNHLGITFEVSHNVLAVAWSALQLIGCIVSYLTVESFGRKKMLLISLIGTSIGLLILAVLVQINLRPFDLSIVIGFIALAASVGLIPLSLVLVTDLMPQKIRTMGATICLTIMWLLGFALLQIHLATGVGIDVYAYLVAGVTMFVGLVVALKLPETQGLGNDEIVWTLER